MNKIQILTLLRKNPAIRTVMYPLVALERQCKLYKYSKSIDAKYFKEKRNQYCGKRCFIIGNGPSLIPEDLDKIKDEYTFGTNRIYHIYDKTNWRPSFYVSTDNNVIASEIGNIKQIGDYPKYLNLFASRYGREKNIWYICPKGKFTIRQYENQADALSEDISKYVAIVNTVTVIAIQIAIYMGFKEIYLLGVDNSFAKSVDKNGKLYEDKSIKSDYFAGMKSMYGEPNVGVSIHYIDSVNDAYSLAEKFSREHGVKIYNATRGGKLEAFERVDFDELMAKKEGER